MHRADRGAHAVALFMARTKNVAQCELAWDLPKQKVGQLGNAGMLTVIDRTQNQAARTVGFINIIAFALLVIAEFALLGPLIVDGDAVHTAHNFLAHQEMLRLAITFDIIYCVGIVVSSAAYYAIFRPVNRTLALFAAFSRLVHAMVWILMTLTFYYALRLLGTAEYLHAFGAPQLQALARVAVSSRFELYYVGLAFWALAQVVCGYLWLKSRYIPRALAIAALATAAWCALITFAYIAMPAVANIVNLWWFDTPMALVDIAMGGWLLVRGLRPAAAT